MNFQFDIFFIVTIGTFFIGAITFRSVNGFWQRFLWVGLIAGVYIYNGVGAAYPGIPIEYIWYYFSFLISVSLSFFFFIAISPSLSHHSGRVFKRTLKSVEQNRKWDLVLLFYLFLHFIPFLYPELRIHDFFSPRLPDLKQTFAMRMEVQDVNPILKVIDYVRILMTPFFFIALYRYNLNIKKVMFILFFLLYIQYANTSYIGRSAFGANALLIFVALWALRKDYRKRLILVGIALTPILLAFFYFYSIIRIGGNVSDFKVSKAVNGLIYQETGFPLRVGIPVIESNRGADLESYFKWMITLPIPKILTGEIAGTRINYEISELILGTSMGSKGWYVVLPGLVAESIYIYGKYFFWIHGMFIGFIGAMMIRLVERTPQLLFLQSYLVVLFFYDLNRAGISGFLPKIVNHFILFYGAMFFLLINPIRKNRKPLKNNLMLNSNVF